MNLEMIKNFLRVDFGDDDELIILMLEAAKEYVVGAIGECNIDDPLVQLLLLNMITNMYEKRTYTVSENDKRQYTNMSIVRQLQLKYELEQDCE